MIRMNFVLLGTAALLVVGHSNPGFAQQGAQPAATAATGLEEIVVTARRREERVQTVPLAITAFSQAALERGQIHEILDLGTHVPSVGTAITSSDSNSTYSPNLRLRGLPGTEIYFADVPTGNADYQGGTGIAHGLSDGMLYDLEDLEVVKGPQGTRFGKNSVGGLISIEPKHPTNDYEGYLRTDFGNYNDKLVEAAVNIPVIEDKLLVRVAGQYQDRDGYTTDVSTGKDLDNKHYYAWRVGVTLQPTDDFKNYLLYDGYWQDSNGGANPVRYINPTFNVGGVKLSALGFTAAPYSTLPVTIGNGPDLLGLFNPATRNATLAAALTAGGVSLYPTLRSAFAAQQALGPRAVLASTIQGIGKDYFYGITDVANWDVLDDLTIKNIAAARIYKQISTRDFTAIGLPILNIGIPGNQRQWGNNSVQYTEELQIQGRSLGEKLEWVVGGYLEYDHPLGDTQLGSSNLLGTPFGATTYNHFNIQSRSQAAFAHGTYDFDDWVPGLKFTAGYRYTWDYNEAQQRSATGVDRVTRNAAGLPSNCPAVFGADINCYQSVSAHFSSPGWNLELAEQLDPTLLLYVRAGNAYRPGGFNLAVPRQFSTFQPEHVTDVEIGTKADWDIMGIHARTNVDAFHSDYKDIQVQQLVNIVDNNGINHTNQLYQNAASATLEGIELEGTIIPIKGLELSPHASFVYANYDQYPAIFGAAQGSKPPFLFFPNIQWGATVTYHLPIDESWGDIALSGTYSWYGHQYDTATLTEILRRMSSYEVFDFRVDWTNIMGKSYDLAFWMTNATDNLYVRGVAGLYAQLGFTSVGYGPPRMYGVTLKMRFGPGADNGLGL
jgi:iron complex outermembrane receptor protein